MSSFVVIVPACNEEGTIGRLIATMRSTGSSYHAIISTNGCRDRTAEVARVAIDGDARFCIVDSAKAGKCGALNRAEAMIPEALQSLPRFFVDADVDISVDDLCRLCRELQGPTPALVSPRISLDVRGCSRLAQLAARGWQQRSYFQRAAFQLVLGVNQTGRARWGLFPEIIADDAFVASHFEPSERRIYPECTAFTKFPRTARAFLGVQRRWIAGDRQLRRFLIQNPDRQRRTGTSAELELSADSTLAPHHRATDVVATATYLGIRATAFALDRAGIRQQQWFRDDSSRHAAR